ncbi:transmembrane protein 6/97 [Hypoxylon trugodes]|uniref:transmembrane protein 6/97 n=1 Tax=Hypoxylon trugodes TaxID=326681 RepID=UPI00218E0B9B|nr:transmembrane protein 6/97 [Hypoxylon trugodes]KAI1382705.1 transmembrane protein 6/97 [Hypoxylon trugodes]
MASSTRYYLDKIYLVYFILHIPILFCVDLVPLYPASLWVPPSAPLHFLYDLRVYYIETYNDQFFAPPPAAIPSFFPLFAFLELVFHLPVSLWAVRALLGGGRGAKQSGLSGSAELLLLVYGIETALTTGTCMYEAFLWDPLVVTAQQKVVLLGGLYGGYLAVAILLTADMYVRLLGRLNTIDNIKKAQ